ncbi:MAG: hypothetical protein Q6J68_06245 [Thermostichales cyanobacterium SZTDM-1c_bins_54]
MDYTFEILGVLPILHFFQYQNQNPPRGAAYIGARRCTLDAFLGSLESMDQSWDLEAVTRTVVAFWLQNQEGIYRWQRRLQDAGQNSLVVARLSHLAGLRQEFEHLFRL